MAAMDLAAESIIDAPQRAALGDMLVALLKPHNTSDPLQKVAITGGIIDMSHLAPELIKYGHPDVAFDLLAADGFPSYYNMAQYDCFTFSI